MLDFAFTLRVRPSLTNDELALTFGAPVTSEADGIEALRRVVASPLPLSAIVDSWEIASATSEGLFYTVVSYWSGETLMLHCPCDGFKYRRDCGHCQEVAERKASDVVAECEASADLWADMAEPEPVRPSFQAGDRVIWNRRYNHKPNEMVPATIVRVHDQDVIVKAQDGGKGPLVQFIVAAERLSAA